MPLPGWTVFHKFTGSFPSFQQNPRHGNQAVSFKGTVTDSNSHSEKSEKGRPGIKGSLGMELRRNTVVNSQASLLDVSYSEADLQRDLEVPDGTQDSSHESIRLKTQRKNLHRGGKGWG